MASQQSGEPKLIKVGDLLVDVGQQCVSRDGAELPLPKLSFDLLLSLIAAAPNFLSQKQLLAEVWPRLIVAVKTVSQRVKLLRDALDASFRGKDYLQWWYTLERDPVWAPFRDNERFIQIASRVHAHINAQRAAIVEKPASAFR